MKLEIENLHKVSNDILRKSTNAKGKKEDKSRRVYFALSRKIQK
jgi:N-acetyl-beta-hexosaminidase